MIKLKEYTVEFRKEAVRLVTEQGYSQAEAARSLGISSKNISRWMKFFTKDGERGKRLSPEQEEIGRLTKENQRLRMEREILKKAAAFFANERA